MPRHFIPFHAKSCQIPTRQSKRVSYAIKAGRVNSETGQVAESSWQTLLSRASGDG